MEYEYGTVWINFIEEVERKTVVGLNIFDITQCEKRE